MVIRTQHINDYKGKKGEYILWKKTYYGHSGWMAGYSYVDLLYKGVTEKFLELTMSGYERVLGADLGPIVKGVFSDEPQINSSGGVRWPPDLFVEFRKRWGYLTGRKPTLADPGGKEPERSASPLFRNIASDVHRPLDKTNALLL